MVGRALLMVAACSMTSACGHTPPRTLGSTRAAAPAAPRALEVGPITIPADELGCARRVVFDVVDLTSGDRAPASLCMPTMPDVADGAWFWLDGTLTVAWPDGDAVFHHRIRARDVDPEGRGRPMRVAIWRGELDGAASRGAYAGRRGTLHGGGVLHFDRPRGARPELLLALELADDAPLPRADDAPLPRADIAPPPRADAPSPPRADLAPLVLVFGDATFGPGTGGCQVDVPIAVRALHGDPPPTARFCTQAIEPDTDGDGWFLIRGELRVTWPDGELVIALRSYEETDPTDDRARILVWLGDIDPAASTGRFHGHAGTLRGAGDFLHDADAHATIELHARIDLP